jgi:phenylacetate-CoA ligase
MTYPSYFESVEAKTLLAEYPIGDEFTARYTGMSRDALHDFQNRQFLKLMARGWQIPFYRRLWGNAGLEPGDIRTIDDIVKLPTYDKSDIMASIEKSSPLGDFAGLDSWPADKRPPVIFHTTSGTTGRPQVLLFGPKGREIGNLLVARMYRWQGLQSSDVVQSVYGHGMINGGHYIREAFTHFTNCLFLSAGTGIETRSASQVQLMQDFGVSVLVGFVDYIRKLADVAREVGLVPGEHINIRMITGHLGTEDRSSVEQAWGGAKAFDWYGVGDTGSIAGEGPDRDGLYIWEDAQFLEVLDIDSGTPVARGSKGDMVVTTLYKDDIFPCIRFNTHDVTQLRTDTNSTGLVFDRIAGFLGRSDNMVKLRGINVFPHAIGAIIQNRSDVTGEYICILERDASGRDEMTVHLEYAGTDPGAASMFKTMLRQGLGVEMTVQLVSPRATAELTQIETRQKPLRLIDKRGL